MSRVFFGPDHALLPDSEHSFTDGWVLSPETTATFFRFRLECH